MIAHRRLCISSPESVPKGCCLVWRISVRPKHYEQVRIHPVRPLVSLSRQAERDVPKWTCAVSTKVYIRLTFTFLAETRKRLLLRCRHECYLAPVGFHHYILLVPASHASSAGDMMAVHQTPLSCSLLICNHCSMEHPFIQHHHILQRGDYPAFWPI